ncbi:MAG: hypothetical protein IIA45_14480 [Bacteroidetes bacterium]|nr:hypothetical protein [Bacteroidota bacterium]
MSALKSIAATTKTGEEKLSYNGQATKYSLLDFWRWSASDILSNVTRGIFAEFLVGTAIGLDPKNIRDEWAAFDLTSKNGIKLEIKSAAYIQSWYQKAYSTISFSIKPAKYWDPETNILSKVSKRHADVYVFCLLKCKDQAIIDPLNLDQWEFYVLPTIELDEYERSQSSLTLNSLTKLTGSIVYDKLKNAIENAYKKQKKASL